MSFYNLPLLWLLAGRNDFLIWITGWSYRAFWLGPLPFLISFLPLP